MEHRCSLRIPVNARAILHAPGWPPAVCSITDIGADGAFLRGGIAACGRHDLVVLSLQLPGESRPRRLEATVVHRSGEGAGVMFLESRADLMQILAGPATPAASPAPASSCGMSGVMQSRPWRRGSHLPGCAANTSLKAVKRTGV